MKFREKKIVSRAGITPVGSPKYRVNRLRFHLLAYVIARKTQLDGGDGRFIIRCDDTDENKINRSFLDSYLEVLSSLGVIADLTPYDYDNYGFSLFQSKRTEMYKRFVVRLLNSGIAFKDSSGAIFFNVEVFYHRYKHLLVENKLPVFDASIGNFMADIRSSISRTERKMAFVPFPIVRANGQYLFHLCSPVDDAMMNVTHIVRDRDKLNILAKQEMVRIALGFPQLIYVHAPLLVNKLGKRFVYDDYYGDATFQDFVSRGILPKALVSYLLSGFVGSSERYYLSIDDFASQVDISRIHRSNTLFTPAVLEQHNKKLLKILSDSDYERSLKKFVAIHDDTVSHTIDQDYYLLKMLIRLKRKLPEVLSIAKSVSSLKYDDCDKDRIHTLKKILEIFSNPENRSLSLDLYLDFLVKQGRDRARELNILNKDYYESVRYLLTGQYQGFDLYELVRYFCLSGKLDDRLEIARKNIEKSEENKNEKR